MPRFYFDVSAGGHFTRDDEGLEMESIKAAEDQAVRTAGEIALEVVPKHPNSEVSIGIRDADGFLLFTVGVTTVVRRTIRGLSSEQGLHKQ